VNICMVGAEGASVAIPPVKGGGIEQFTTRLANDFTAKGHQVTIACEVIGDRSQIPGVNFYRVKTARLLNKLRTLGRPGARLSQFLFGLDVLLFLFAKAKEFDIIQFNSLWAAFFASVFRALLRKPMIYVVHSAYPWNLEYEHIRLGSRLVLKLRSFTKRRMNRVIVGSARITQNIMRYTGMEAEKFTVIPYATDTNLFNPRYGKRARVALSIGNSELVILFVGRLTEAKGVEYLLRAVPLVKREVVNARFVVAGSLNFDGVIPQRWRNLCNELDIEDEVIFTGEVSHYETLPKLYASADMFVLPTMGEVSPAVIGEAMASGLPIVSTDCADIPLWISECGIVVNKQDEGDLARAIIRLANDHKLREGYSKKAVEAAKIFSAGKCANDYEQVYIECVENK